MKTKAILLASSAVAALSLTAPAQAAGNWYVSVFGGANWSDDHRIAAATSTSASADTLSWVADSDTGFIVGGAVGYGLTQLAPGLRVEVEAAYRENQVDGLWQTNVTTPTVVSTGNMGYDFSTFSVMANLWYDFPIAGVTPYVGGGIGWARTDADVDFIGGTTVSIDYDDSGFAWQLGAGIDFDVSPNMKLGVGYRYFQGPDVTIPGTFGGGGSVAAGDLDSEHHSAIVNLRVAM
jgi:opacity protein-like surface antigen